VDKVSVTVNWVHTEITLQNALMQGNSGTATSNLSHTVQLATTPATPATAITWTIVEYSAGVVEGTFTPGTPPTITGAGANVAIGDGVVLVAPGTPGGPGGTPGWVRVRGEVTASPNDYDYAVISWNF
jgi:hypothetical protein